jgi:hypothetical protein
MSTATPGAPVAPVPVPVAGRPSPVRAEVLRLRSRRMVRVLAVLGLVGLLAGVAVAFTQFAKPSAAGRADAAQRRQQIVDQVNRGRQECLSAVGTTHGPSSKADCGLPTTPDEVGSVDNFLGKQPFDLAVNGRAGILAVSGAFAAIAFLLGASFVGAEWSTRSMVALLFWEPRRRTVIAAKVAVVAVAGALLGSFAEGLWLAAAGLLAATRGVGSAPTGLWVTLVGSAGRGVVLVAVMALLGFGIANLIRNTAAALGVGFVYVAVVETALRALRPAWQRWLLTDNAIALLTPGGLHVFLDQGFVDARGQYQESGREILVSNLHGGLILTAATLAVLVAGIVLFGRRDLN